MKKISYKKERITGLAFVLLCIVFLILLFKGIPSYFNIEAFQDTLLLEVWNSLKKNFRFAFYSTVMLLLLCYALLFVYYMRFPMKIDEIAKLVAFIFFVGILFNSLTVVLLMTLTIENAEAYIATLLFVFGLFKLLPKLYRIFKDKFYSS